MLENLLEGLGIIGADHQHTHIAGIVVQSHGQHIIAGHGKLRQKGHQGEQEQTMNQASHSDYINQKWGMASSM